MDQARPSISNSLLPLQEAARQLGVTVEVLLTWNENNILKPTITPTGHIGYTQEQVTQFLTIRQVLNQGNMPKTQEMSVSPISVAAAEASLPELNNQPRHISKLTPMLAAGFGVFVIVLFIFQMTNNQTLNTDTSEPTKQESAGKQTSTLTLSDPAPSTVPVILGEKLADSRNLHAEGEEVFKEKSITNDFLPAKKPSNVMGTNSVQERIIATLLGQQDNASSVGDDSNGSSGLSVLASQKTCDDCRTQKDDSNLAFDENGNIKGEAKTDTAITTLERIGSGINPESLSPAGNQTMQLILLPIALLVLLFTFRRQFAFATGLPRPTIASPLAPVLPTWEKILEVSQKTDGTVILLFEGKEFKISKPELYSESDQFIERLMELSQFNHKELEYDSQKDDKLRLTTPLSRLVTRLGFVGIKRDLFFPRTSKQMVLFRKYVTRLDLADMNLTTSQILQELTASY